MSVKDGHDWFVSHQRNTGVDSKLQRRLDQLMVNGTGPATRGDLSADAYTTIRNAAVQWFKPNKDALNAFSQKVYDARRQDSTFETISNQFQTDLDRFAMVLNHSYGDAGTSELIMLRTTVTRFSESLGKMMEAGKKIADIKPSEINALAAVKKAYECQMGKLIAELGTAPAQPHI